MRTPAEIDAAAAAIREICPELARHQCENIARAALEAADRVRGIDPAIEQLEKAFEELRLRLTELERDR